MISNGSRADLENFSEEKFYSVIFFPNKFGKFGNQILSRGKAPKFGFDL